MEATALCLRLFMAVLMPLVAHVQESYPQTSALDIAVQILPTRLQLFEYESVSFACEGVNVSAGWKVRNNKEFIKKCTNDTVTSTVTCTLDFAFRSDSGEYWCESKGKRSNAVYISVTSGSVILESPVLPVMEWDSVALTCREKKHPSNFSADFYKDGLFIASSSTREMIIHSIFKSDEGLYKCHIPGAGESPESWLAVKAGVVILESPVLPVMKGHDVNLTCKKNNISSTVTADFFKDGLHIVSSSTGEMIIDNVSKSDEGLYKCRISGAGESLESWLAVRDSCRETCSSPDLSIYVLLLLRTVFTILMVTLLLLLVGLLHCGKLTGKDK